MWKLFDGLIFDLDGTLWDSADTVCRSWNLTLERLAPEFAGRITRSGIEGCMGMLMDDILRRLLPELREDRFSAVLDGILTDENAYVEEHGGVLYPHVPETLALLAARYPLFIVSNCQDGYIEAFFQAHGLGGYFTDYEDPGRTGKPKGDNIRLVMERNGLKQPLYIGDTQGDWNAACQAGVPFLHAAYGFGRVPEHLPAVQDFAELPAAAEALSPP